MGPALQDLWMLLSGDRRAMTQQLLRPARGLRGLHALRTGASCLWLEALRTLRLIHYSAWLARAGTIRRFPPHFPGRHAALLADRILELREQIAAMDEEPLSV